MRRHIKANALACLILVAPLILAFLVIGLTITTHERLYRPMWLAGLIGFGIAGVAVAYFAWQGKGVPGDTLAVALPATIIFLVLWAVFLRFAGAHTG